MSFEISNAFNTQNKPAFCGSKAMKLANRWRRQLKHIELTPDSPVSDVFVKEIAQGIGSTGIVGKKIIKAQNTKFVLAQKSSDAFPDTKGKRIPGWPKGTTYDNCQAINRDGVLGFFENPLESEKTFAIKVTAPDIRHETGHEIHQYFEKVIGIDFVETKGFTEAYLKDITNFPEIIKKYEKKFKNLERKFRYVIQGSTPKKADYFGKVEAFAEIFAMLNGGSYCEKTFKERNKLYKKLFPNTTAYVEKLLWLLGKR